MSLDPKDGRFFLWQLIFLCHAVFLLFRHRPFRGHGLSFLQIQSVLFQNALKSSSNNIKTVGKALSVQIDRSSLSLIA
jgi:hypothetical protein